MRRFFLLLTAALGIAHVAHAQSSLNFSRNLTLSELGTTGFAALNPTAAAASATFTLFSPSGFVVATSMQTIPAGGQLARLASELFPQATAGGWVQMTSDTSGLSGFWLAGDFRAVGDGAESSVPSADLVFPLITEQTAIHLVNPQPAPMAITFRLFGADGAELAPAVVQPLAARGALQINVAAAFPPSLLTQAAHVRASCTMPFSGSAVIQNFPAGPSIAVMNGIDARSTSTEIFLPHVVSGPLGASAYATTFGVTNLSGASQTVTASLYTEFGQVSSVQRTLPELGSLREDLLSFFGLPSGFTNGWIRISGSAPLTAYAVLAETSAGGVSVVPAQTRASPEMFFSHIADLSPWWTGIAVVNPSNLATDVEVFAMNPNGTLIGGAENVATAIVRLNPGQKRALLLSELIPATQNRSSDGGFIFLRSTTGAAVTGLELFFTRSGTILSHINGSSLPVGLRYFPPPP